MIAKSEGKPAQATAMYLPTGATRQYIQEGLQVENETQGMMKAELILRKPPRPFITELRKHPKHRSQEQPRSGNQYYHLSFPR